LYNTNYILHYLAAIIITFFPVIVFFYLKKIIDRIMLIILCFFFIGWILDFSQAVLLVGFNKHHTLSHYFCIFPGLLFTFSLYEIVFEKGFYKSIIYATSFTFILLVITFLDAKSQSNVYADFVYNIQILIICLIYIYKSFSKKNLFQNEKNKLKSIFIHFTMSYYSVSIYLSLGREYYYQDIKNMYLFLDLLITDLNLFVHYSLFTYTLFQVAKRNNAGKITFGANADE
jgi:hypothetical protein